MDPTVAFIIALITGVVGLVLGLGISPFRKSKPRERMERIEESPPPAHSGLVEVARLFTDGSGRRVFLQVRGRFVRSMDDLKPENRAYLARMFDQLHAWIGPAEAAPKETSPTSASGATQAGAPTPRPSSRLGALETQAEGVKPPSMDVVDVMTRALRADSPVKPVLKSIPEQVDEILRESLEGTPLQHRGIRLLEAPNKDLVVLVGQERYTGIDEVPEAEIRAALKAAVAEWERRSLTSQ